LRRTRQRACPIGANSLSRLELVRELVEGDKVLAPKPACYFLGLRGVLESLVELVLVERRDIYLEVSRECLACVREVAVGSNKVIRRFVSHSVTEGARWSKAEVFLK